MQTPRRLLGLLTAGVLLVSACAGDSEAEEPAAGVEPSNSESSTTSMPPSPSPESDSTVVDRTPVPSLRGELTIPEWFVDEGILPTQVEEKARDLIAAKRGVNPDAVSLIGSMFVTWSDSGLGCKIEGESYVLPVLTDGYLAFFNVDGDDISVHTDTKDTVKICRLPGDWDILPRS